MQGFVLDRHQKHRNVLWSLRRHSAKTYVVGNYLRVVRDRPISNSAAGDFEKVVFCQGCGRLECARTDRVIAAKTA